MFIKGRAPTSVHLFLLLEGLQCCDTAAWLSKASSPQISVPLCPCLLPPRDSCHSDTYLTQKSAGEESTEEMGVRAGSHVFSLWSQGGQ